MADLQKAFKQASLDAQKLPKRPDNATMLHLYALYKQGSTGNVVGKRPGFTNPVGRAKHDAWSEHKGTTSETAMQSYIDLVEELK